jgi:hypothetical protein
MSEGCCPKAQVNAEPVLIVEDEQKETEQQFLLNKQARSSERFEICKQCPDLMALNMCRYCKCFMNIKTRIYSAKCPIGKW